MSGDRDFPDQAEMQSGPQMGQPMAMCDKEYRGPPLERKKELMLMAMGIAAQVTATTTRRERCMLRSMVEMFVGD